MGADLIYGIAEWPKDVDGKAVEPSENLKNILLDRLEASLDENLDWEDYGIFAQEEDDDEERERLYNWAKDWIVALFEKGHIPRDMTTLHIKEGVYLMSADMSWGDTSESIQFLCFLDGTMITEEPVE